jgi:hypothetical protein
VDGYRWHIGKEVKDRVKNEQLNDMGIKLFRIRDKRLPPLSNYDVQCNDTEDDIFIIQRLLESIIKHIPLKRAQLESIEIYLLGSSLQNPVEYERILSYLPAPPPENSLAGRYIDLSKEWHYQKNSPLTPENFTPSARANVWWKCPHGHEYKSFIYNRIKGVGCPYCAGKRVSSDNNLAGKEPRLVREWNLSRNEVSPEKLYFRSTTKVWWICKRAHEWLASPQKRVLGRGCPYCAGRRK